MEWRYSQIMNIDILCSQLLCIRIILRILILYIRTTIKSFSHACSHQRQMIRCRHKIPILPVVLSVLVSTACVRQMLMSNSTLLLPPNPTALKYSRTEFKIKVYPLIQRIFPPNSLSPTSSISFPCPRFSYTRPCG